MKRRLKNAVNHWLDAERRDADGDAEKALSAVFSALPLPSLPAEFAESVLIRVGLAPAAVTAHPARLVWAWRATVALCLSLATVSVVLLPSYLPSLIGLMHPGRVVDLGLGALLALIQRFGTGLVFWRALSTVGNAISSVLSSPPYMLALGVVLLTSFGAFRLLNSLILSERSAFHVRST